MPDKEKIIKGLKKLHGTSETMTLIAETITLLETQPEIVRCKDCKYYRYYGPDNYISSECTLEKIDGPIPTQPIPTWFCANGKRRDDNALIDKVKELLS